MEKARRALGTTPEERAHRHVVQGAGAEWGDDGLRLVGSEAERISPPNNLYLVGVDRGRPVIVDLPGQGHARGADVGSLDVKHLTAFCEDTRVFTTTGWPSRRGGGDSRRRGMSSRLETLLAVVPACSVPLNTTCTKSGISCEETTRPAANTVAPCPPWDAVGSLVDRDRGHPAQHPTPSPGQHPAPPRWEEVPPTGTEAGGQRPQHTNPESRYVTPLHLGTLNPERVTRSSAVQPSRVSWMLI